jgi:hypothetical protein
VDMSSTILCRAGPEEEEGAGVGVEVGDGDGGGGGVDDVASAVAVAVASARTRIHASVLRAETLCSRVHPNSVRYNGIGADFCLPLIPRGRAQSKGQTTLHRNC